MRKNGFKFIVVLETAILGFAALALLGFVLEQSERGQDALREQIAAAQATEMYIALTNVTPTPMPPTITPAPTNTSTPTIPPPTNTVAPTNTPEPTETPQPTDTPAPTDLPQPSITRTPVNTATRTRTRTPTLSPTFTSTPRPTLTPTPTLSPTPRPTEGPTPIPWRTLNQCGVIDASGYYRLGSDLTANGDCITIKASYVVFDCMQHSIRGTNTIGSGVAIRRYGLIGNQTPAYVEVRGCRISKFHDGILVDAGDRLVIRNNESSDNADDVDPVTRFGKFLGMVDGAGIRLNATTNSQILNNTTKSQAIGIDVRNSSGITVRGNIASDNSAWGINILRTQNSQVSENTTADNIRRCTWGAGEVGEGCDAGGIIMQDGSNGITVAKNQVIGRNGNGVFIKAHAYPCGSNNSIIGNTITGFLYNAVELGFCGGNKINDNQIRDGLDGVWLGFAHDTEIRGNTIVNMRNHGVISSNSYGNTVAGNSIINSNEGVFFYSENYDRNVFGWLPPGDYTSHNNCLCNNTFQSNAVAVHLSDSTQNQVTGNTYNNNVRTFWVQGRNDGNNLQSYNQSSAFLPAMRFDIFRLQW